HIEFFGLAVSWIIHVFSDQDLVYLLSFGRSLWSDQVHSDDLSCDGFNLLKVLGKFHPATFTTSTCMNLSFDHMPAGTGLFSEFFCSFYCFFCILGYYSALDANAKTAQDLFSLIFVYIHSMLISSEINLCSTKVANVIGLYQSFLPEVAGPQRETLVRII